MGLQTESLQVITRPGDNTGVGTSVAIVDVNGLQVNAPARHKQGDNVLHDKMVINREILATTVDNTIFAPMEGTWKVYSFVYTPRVAGSGGAATIDLKVCTGTQAPTSGTTQLSAALDLVGVADTTQQATIIAAPTEIGPGSRLAFDLTGTLTAVVGSATVQLIRVR